MTSVSDKTKAIQEWAGVRVDGAYGPKTADAIIGKAKINIPAPRKLDVDEFKARFVNMSAPAMTLDDQRKAAAKLGVPLKHIKAIAKVEAGPFGSFDKKGRPIILAEPHIFSRRTGHRYDRSHRHLSSPTWNRKLYPRGFDGRWGMLAEMASLDGQAALESASWGLYQVMGFHWLHLGYKSIDAMVDGMVKKEAAHLDALVRFIQKNLLTDELKACKAGNPDSCRAFVRAYNGKAYYKNKYHVKMANALK